VRGARGARGAAHPGHAAVAAACARGSVRVVSRPLLRARGLSVGYPGRRLLASLDLDVASGEVLAVLGANGSGKSTLLRTLTGLQPALAGTVELDGQAVAALDRVRIARVVAYLPQAHAPGPLTVRETVLLGRAPHIARFARPREADVAIADDALAAVGMLAHAQRPLARMSGGERQLVGIARVLAQGARLLFFDEPTTGLDLGNQTLVVDRIGELAARGLAVVFTTHDPRHAAAVASRALLLLRDGAAQLAPVSAALDPALLERVYGVPVRL